MAAEPTLRVTELVCGYAERGLFAPVSFALAPGQAIQITGANGQGKTTLLRTIAGLGRPLAGRVAWQADSQLLDDLCFIGHDNALNGALTPLENLELLLRLSGKRASAYRVRDTLIWLGLERPDRRPCGRLSAGQCRRVALARLWLMRASLWVLDEPAAALDAAARRLLCARMAEFVANGGMLLFTTHEPLELPDVVPEHMALQPRWQPC